MWKNCNLTQEGCVCACPEEEAREHPHAKQMRWIASLQVTKKRPNPLGQLERSLSTLSKDLFQGLNSRLRTTQDATVYLLEYCSLTEAGFKQAQAQLVQKVVLDDVNLVLVYMEHNVRAKDHERIPLRFPRTGWEGSRNEPLSGVQSMQCFN